MPAISLYFENNIGIYIFVFLFLPLAFFYKAKTNTILKSNIFYLSKTTNLQLQGLFIIVIIIHHLSQKMQTPGLMQLFWYVGFLSVGIFFFISGVGLTKSLKLQESYLKGFLQKKILRIYIPFIIINIITLLAFYRSDVFFSIDTSLEYIIGIKLIDGTLWFIETIMLFYFFFYISFLKKNNTSSVIIVSLLVLTYMVISYVLEMGPHTYVSSFCFLLGIYYIFFEEEINLFISRNFLKLLFLSLFLFLFFLIFQQSIRILIVITPIFFIASCFILFLKVKPTNYFFGFLGSISLEIYLLHMKILLIFSKFTHINSGLWVIIYLSILIFIAYVFNKFNSFLYNNFIVLFNNSFRK